MFKIFDAFTAKSYQFMVKETSMVEVMNMIHSAKATNYHADGKYVGDCGIADETNHWFINTNLTSKQWYALLEECKIKKYQLVIKDDPSRMYFTKVKES